MIALDNAIEEAGGGSSGGSDPVSYPVLDYRFNSSKSFYYFTGIDGDVFYTETQTYPTTFRCRSAVSVNITGSMKVANTSTRTAGSLYLGSIPLISLAKGSTAPVTESINTTTNLPTGTYAVTTDGLRLYDPSSSGSVFMVVVTGYLE